MDYHSQIDPDYLISQLKKQTFIEWAQEYDENNIEYRGDQERWAMAYEVQDYVDELEELEMTAEEFVDEYFDLLIQITEYEGDMLEFALSDCQLPMVAEMHSNYDCQNSNHYVGGTYDAEESYFGDILKVLSISADKVRNNEFIEVIRNNNIQDGGYVNHAEFTQEMGENMATGLFTFLFTINAYDYLKWLWRNEGTDNKLTVQLNKNTNYGIWSTWMGGGSIMDATLLKPLTITDGKAMDDSGYLSFDIDIDGKCGYGIVDSCGLYMKTLEEAIIVE